MSCRLLFVFCSLLAVFAIVLVVKVAELLEVYDCGDGGSSVAAVACWSQYYHQLLSTRSCFLFVAHCQ